MSGRTEAEALLADLVDRGIQVWAAGDEVSFRAPKGAWSEELRTALIRQKPALLELLGQRRKHAPSSFAQERLWFLGELEAREAVDVVFVAWRLHGELSPAVLKRTFEELGKRHETLRTVFLAVDGRPVQVVLPTPKAPFLELDLSRLPLPAAEAEARRLAAREFRRRFDLGRGPLMRTELLRLAPGDHVLFASIHHIAADGWSLSVLDRELSLLYAALAAGRRPSLPPLPIQYSDFAVAQRWQLRGETLAGHLAYWRKALAGPLPEVLLPSDRPRRTLRSFDAGALTLRVGRETTAALQRLNRRVGATSYMTLLAAFMTLLYRTTAERDLVVGSPVANRNRRDVEGLIGFFVNNLVMRLDLTGRPGFAELVRRARETALQAYEHQDLPFEKLVEELQPERSLNRHPLFQISFAVQNTPESDFHLPGLVAEEFDVEVHRAPLDLVVHLFEPSGGGTVDGQIVYRSALFDATTIARLGRHFTVLLAAVAEDPERPIDELPLLPPGELHQLRSEWSRGTEADLPARTLDEAFAAQAARTPEAVAVTLEEVELTYRELADRAEALAGRLCRLGVGPEVPVALLLRRTPEMVVGIFAALRAGGAFLPLDPETPTERLGYYLDQSRAPVVLTTETLSAGLPERHRGRAMLLDDDPGLTPAPLGPGSDPRRAAYVIFTSGSTGRPKGVVVEHRQAVRYAGAITDRFAFSPGLGYALVQPLHFDISLTMLFGALLTGGTLHLLGEDDAVDAQALRRLFTRRRVDVLKITPSHLAALDPLPLPRRVLIFGGEALLGAQAARWLKAAPAACELHNHYGPTETTVGTLTERLEPAATPQVALGRPLAHACAFVADAALRTVPAGVAGELLLGGACVARGYLRRPGRTAASFVPDPWTHTPGERLYRTGDLARFLAGGRIEFLGRRDQQVKLRGFRIELGEVESALAAHPDVREAAVAVHRQGHVSQLVGYVVPARETERIEENLIRWLRQRLPPFMVPSFLELRPALPRAAQGKLDRRALAREGPAQKDTDRAVPRNSTEQFLLGLWKEVLGRTDIGIRDDFFALGGHSLLATQVISRVRQYLGRELPLKSLFAKPTVEQLADEVEQILRRGPALELPPLRAAARTGPLPLSFAQQRLWFLHQLRLGQAAYNMPSSLSLQGSVDVAALDASLQEIVRRHEVLRTTFPTQGGEPLQSISAEARATLTVIDLQRLPSTAMALLAAEALRPFDLERGPLMRCLLLRLGSLEHVLFLNLHHIVSDGWSRGVLHRELAALYEAFSGGRPSPLPELAIQYADFAVWQRGWIAEQRSVLDAWRQRFEDLTPLALPTDRQRTASVAGCGGASHELALPPEVSHRLRILSRRYGASLYMVLLTGFMALLSRLCRQREVVVGSPIANRNHRDIEGLIGFFVNMMVMRGDLSREGSAEPSYSTLLQRVRSIALEAYAHQDVPFDKLARELAPQRDLSLHPIFQVTFALQNAPRFALQLPGLQVEPLEVETEVARFDLELFFWEQGEEVEGSMVYNVGLLDATTVLRFTRSFLNLLRGAAERPELRLDELPLLGAAERHQMLFEWNDRRTSRPREACLHQLIEDQAARTPEATAVAFEDEELSYRELDRRANRLAHELRRRGVVPERRVGVCLDRSIALVVAVLGILKAGGTYVPLDPESPQERLAFLLEDSECRLVLSTGPWIDRLPEPSAVLDVETSHIARHPASKPPEAVSSENAAYLIYTSGSTGKPKGAVNVHRSLALYLRWLQTAYPLHPADRMLHKAPLSFDAALRELLWPLTAGARLCLAPPGAHRDPHHLVDLVRKNAITVLGFVPSMLPYFLDELGHRASSSLRRVVVSGEALPETLRKRFHRELPEVELINSYGPAEAAVATVTWPFDARDERPQVPIGRGTDDTSAYLLDTWGRPVPLGAVGEIHLAGEQLGRGYLGHPGQTAQAFVPDPFGEGRLYRTGDLARYRGDGALLFVGRRDLQLKIRGMRVEPGEVETTLRRHPAVADAAVVVGKEAGNPQLRAYVVESRESRVRQQEQQVRLWRQVHEDLHGDTVGGIAGDVDRQTGTAGWNSSFTGQPIPAEEMDEWVGNTVKRILATEPRRVLEIGCGSGLLLERIAPRCSLYVGTDISRQALNTLERRLELSAGRLPHVRLFEKEADDLEGLGTTFDTVVLNSVAQYLPGVEYLLKVLSGAATALQPGGTLFVGDVRSLPLLDAFYALVELHRSPEATPPQEIRAMAQWRRRREEELVIDPAFFFALRRALPRVHRVRILPKDGRYPNELNLFRYDVFLHLDDLGGELPRPERLPSLPGSEARTLEDLRRLLSHQEREAVLLRRIPNARLAAANRLLALLERPGRPRSVAELRRELVSAAPEGVEPSDLKALAEELSYQVELSWAEGRSDGSYDAFFWRSAGFLAGAEPPAAERPWKSYANDPLLERTARELVPQLREHLRGSLPDYMLPASIELFGELPSLPSGKVDRARLRQMSTSASTPGRATLAEDFVAPRGPIEKTLAGVWSEVIGIEAVGVRDNFFELGGDSILSIQVVAKARQRGLELRPRDLFEKQTIADLAKHIAAPEGAKGEALSEQGLVTGEVPLTPIQRAFFEWDLEEPWHYNQAVLLKTRRPLRPALLEESADRLLRHHDALRLRFRPGNDGWTQHIPAPERPRLLTLDLSRLSQEGISAAIETASAEIQASLDLRRGPLVRVAWFHLGAGEPGRLLIAVHHLAVDRVSWGFLLEDFESVYLQLEEGRPVSLPPKSTSLKAWSERLMEERPRQELSFWLAGNTATPLPVDFEGGSNLVMATDSVPVVLEAETTRLLLQRGSGTGPERIEAFLATALLQALAPWTGRRSLLLEMERHGREAIFEDVDLFRTAGWFTVVFPILLELPENSPNPLRAIQEQIEAIPRRGFGYPLLRYLSPERRDRERLASLPTPEVSLNYLGRLDRILPQRSDSLFEYAEEPIGPAKSRRGRFRHRLALGGGILGGRLTLHWTYSRSSYHRATMERLAREFCHRLEDLTRSS